MTFRIDERFRDNRRGWWIGESPEHMARLHNNRYFYECRAPGLRLVTRPLEFPLRDPFELWCLIERVDVPGSSIAGDPGRGHPRFGLVWGLVDDDNYSAFLVSAYDAAFCIERVDHGEPST